MAYWSWWASGAALAGMMLLHWLLLGRSMSVSGRYTSIVGWWRGRSRESDMSREELLAAMRRATAEAFGEQAVASATEAPPPRPAAPEPPSTSLLFLVSVGAGGLLSALLAGAGPPVPGLRGALHAAIFPHQPLAAGLLLLLGGMLVGFGTRMAGGCTSGHGLNGLSRFQPGSAASTAAFFGAGVVASLLMGALL